MKVELTINDTDLEVIYELLTAQPPSQRIASALIKVSTERNKVQRIKECAERSKRLCPGN